MDGTEPLRTTAAPYSRGHPLAIEIHLCSPPSVWVPQGKDSPEVMTRSAIRYVWHLAMISVYWAKYRGIWPPHPQRGLDGPQYRSSARTTTAGPELWAAAERPCLSTSRPTFRSLTRFYSRHLLIGTPGEWVA
jgi:hypothetical protein